MPCNNPVTAYQPLDGGKLAFGKEPPNSRELRIPCGDCRGCKQRHSQEWALRCVHEAQLHKQNCFVTLTYDDDHLPKYGSLNKIDLQKFFKRLRYHHPANTIRYYACGEYGEETMRAHYHACLFGIDFQDKIQFRKIKDHTLYISETLKRIWSHGNVSIGNLTHETASYTASYVHKRLTHGKSLYNRLDEETGEIIPLQQPFAIMSLNPAIGLKWAYIYHNDIYAKDYIVVKGVKRRPSRFYDNVYDTIDPSHMEQIKQQRVMNAIPLTPQELRAREENTRARVYSRKQI